MTQRTIAALVAVPLVLALLVAAWVQPLPFVTYEPGLTINVLGTTDGNPVISIEGAKTYPVDGQLRLTTVYVSRRESKLDLYTLMGDWFSGDDAVYPKDVIYPKGETQEQDQQQGQVEMVSSQDTATAAALTELGYDIKPAVEVVLVEDGTPAEGNLKVRDIFEKVNGKPVTSAEVLVNAITAATPGKPIDFQVLRKGKHIQVSATPKVVGGREPDRRPARHWLRLPVPGRRRHRSQHRWTECGHDVRTRDLRHAHPGFAHRRAHDRRHRDHGRRRRHRRSDRRHPTKDRRCSRSGCRALPGAGRQLRRRDWRGQRRHASGAGPDSALGDHLHQGVGGRPGRRPTDLPGSLVTDPLADLEVDPALAAAVFEIETHVSQQGWDRPAQLYALVDTAELVAHEPALAAAMGLDSSAARGSLTPVEQDQLAPDQLLERVLETIVWPPGVRGCAAVVERLVLPPNADGAIPDDPTDAEEFAREHPDRQEVRIVAGVTRDGSTYCALRLRAHDDPQSVVGGVDLVPQLLGLLGATLEEESGTDDSP